ncbi:MAG: 23S rRNA (adenine(1618)-N(6))-methyltransferase RlmF [Bacteroidota bacterium]
MATNQSTNTLEKNNLHPRNLHRYRYDFEDLVKTCPALKPFVFINKYQTESIDFANPEAVKLLNKAILMHFYSLKNWDIPAGYLCPPVPGRADYIHYLSDLLSISNSNIIPRGSSIKILDIGVGANCIYPIVGSKEYGWQFVGTDIDPLAIKSAENIVKSNTILKGKIECRLQNVPQNIFEGIIQSGELFDAVICNPPFHASAEEALEGNRRKLTNLAEKSGKNIQENELNFGGHSHELWCEGGEKAFILKMVKESLKFKNQCLWFTSLVSNQSHLKSIENALKNAKVAKTKIIEMAQGQKISRFIAWTFMKTPEHAEWSKKNQKI